MIHFETERLSIRNFRPGDWEALYAYLSQDEVLKYEPETANTEAECRAKADERSLGDIFLAVCLKETGQMIGHIYFNQEGPAEFMTWEIGYIFNPSFKGRGYATEAARGVIKLGFETMGAHRIMAMCNPENAASWKLLERLGMRREGHEKKKAFFRRTPEGSPLWHDAYVYAMLEEEWFGRAATRP